jgi:hypothetical protein
VDEDPSSETCFALIKTWLSDCDREHKECNEEHIATPFIPTRLIKVGTSSDSVIPFLVETKDCQEEDWRYLALSHCWGKADGIQATKTTTTNINSHKKGIPYALLPKTFQDFVLIARTLNVAFVWIDSLCIIQDSVSDWEHEASRMAEVYSKAYCTIAADAAENGNIGCLVPRNPLAVQICDIRNVGGSEEAHMTGIDDDEDDDEGIDAVINILPPQPEWSTMVDRSILSTRAWTLQERLLSPRIIHYTTHELVWECRTTQFSEYMHNTGVVHPFGFKDPDRILDNPLDSSIPAITFPRWYDLVDQFSARRLTVESDRLPALSGLVHHIQSHKGWTYVAGMWKEDIEQGLYWEPVAKDKPHRPSKYRAPSWSWVSIEGRVRHHCGVVLGKRPNLEGSPKILDINVNLAGSDPGGQVKDGSLKVVGVIRNVADYRDEADTYSYQYKGDKPVVFDFDTADDANVRAVTLLRFRVHKDVKTMKALVLAPVPDLKMVFRRIGIAHVKQGHFDYFDDCSEEIITIV